MKLADYLARKRLSQKKFAQKAGLSTGTVSLLVRDLVWISREAAQKISLATKGKVTANDFVHRNFRGAAE
jgi:transcriptional regulator with XRE-family HTH domain